MKGANVGRVMSRDVLSFHDDRTVSELATFLTENEISGVAVVDRLGKPVGVVSVTDIAQQRVVEGSVPASEREWDGASRSEDMRGLRVTSESTLVKDIMTPTVYTIPEETPIAEAARTMIAGRIHRLFVTRKGSIVGIVTPLDLLKVLVGDEAPA